MSKLCGFVSPDGDKAYFFTEGRYVRYDVTGDAVDDGYPLPIGENWPGLFDSDVDAALPWTDGSVYFFKSDQCAKYDWQADRVADGYPVAIGEEWPGLFEAGIDAAVLLESGNAYFFQGDKYLTYDSAGGQFAGDPAPIADDWPGLFESGIETALRWPSGNLYFFSGSSYSRFDLDADAVPDGYPQPITDWTGLPIGPPAAVPDGSNPVPGSAVSVRDYFPTFTEPLEGRVAWMYQDVKGLVTVAVGNLIDTPEEAAALPFEHRDTHLPATRDEIVAEWNRIKSAPGLAKGGHLEAKKIRTLELSDAAMDDLVHRRFDVDEARLAAFYPDWANWPADARLGAHSIAWSGSFFPTRWTNFNAAANAGDWTTAAAQSHLQEDGNPGIKPRNKADFQLFTNAAAVVAQGLDRSKIYYPAAL